MMGTKTRSFSPLPCDVSLEELVPEDHFYRRLQARLDLSFVRELVGPLYATGGRPSVDPVVFFKLQLVMFFEDIRSERQLMGAVADRLSLRWYLGYDLHEPLPDHSSLTRIRERFGLEVFRRFFERIVQECVEAGLVWGEELFFDATKVEANASMESRVPRFAAEAHLGGLFGDEGAAETEAGGETAVPTAEADLDALPAATDRGLRASNAERKDWISKEGRPDRTIVRHRYRRRSDYELSPTDPDASLMQHKRGATRIGYHAHYVVDGGKARVILQVLVTPADVTENQPMLDLLWRTAFPLAGAGSPGHGRRHLRHQRDRSGRRGGRHSRLRLDDRLREDPPLLRDEHVRLRRRERPLQVPAGGTLAPVHSLLHREAHQVPGRARGLQRLPPQAPVHARREWSGGQAQLLRGTPRKGQGLPRDRALRKGFAQAQGVGGAALRGGQGVARDEALQAKDALAGERRGPGDRRRTEREATTRFLGQGTEEASAGGCPVASGTDPFGERPTPEGLPSSEIRTAPRGFFNTLTPSAKCKTRDMDQSR